MSVENGDGTVTLLAVLSLASGIIGGLLTQLFAPWVLQKSQHKLKGREFLFERKMAAADAFVALYETSTPSPSGLNLEAYDYHLRIAEDAAILEKGLDTFAKKHLIATSKKFQKEIAKLRSSVSEMEQMGYVNPESLMFEPSDEGIIEAGKVWDMMEALYKLTLKEIGKGI